MSISYSFRKQIFPGISALLLSMSTAVTAQPIAISGGTLVDVSNAGHSSNDIVSSTVLIDNDRILYAGPTAKAKIPRNALRINARGKFIVPGLIEGFGALQSQGFANAYLYEGVTSVFLADPVNDTRRGVAFLDAKPGPRVLLGAMMNGYSEKGEDDPELTLAQLRTERPRLTPEQLRKRMETLHENGVRCVMIFYNTWPDQVDQIVRDARRLGMGTIGELGFTSYPYAARAGVGAFVHDQKYHTELAPFDVRLAWTDDPFGPAGLQMNRALWQIDPESEAVKRWGQFLAASTSYLMPTLSLSANMYPGFPKENPWLRPAATLVAEDQLFKPLDRVTGEPAPLPRPAEYLAAASQGIRTEMQIDRHLHDQGARFLAASGSSAFGTLPGGGMHEEMQILVSHVGLSPREALAAATSNYAEALQFTDLGEVVVGRRADILLLRSDPRTSVTALNDIDIVIAQGAVVDRPALLQYKIPKDHPVIESE